MSRLRAFLPLLILVAIGIGLLLSGALDRFAPSNLGVETERLRGLVQNYPVAAALTQIVVVMLGISTVFQASSCWSSRAACCSA